MIGTYEIKVTAARPNMPLPPMFAFKDSPSSLRIMDVPRQIGTWEIQWVRASIKYPDNSTLVKSAVRTGNVWVVTFNGCGVAGKVGNGLEILAGGMDEGGRSVTNYVLGVGDIYILERDSSIKPDDTKFYVKWCETVPATPAKGDVMVEGDDDGNLAVVRFFNGERWLKQEVPTKVSQLENDAGYITASEIPSEYKTYEDTKVELVADGFATTSWVEQKNYLSSIPSEYLTYSATKVQLDADGFVTASWVQDQGYLSTIPSTYKTYDETKVALDADGFVTASWVQSQSYATESYVATYVASQIGAVLSESF